MVGRGAELVQLAGAQLEQLQLGDGHRGVGAELVQLAGPLLAQPGQHGGGLGPEGEDLVTQMNLCLSGVQVNLCLSGVRARTELDQVPDSGILVTAVLPIKLVLDSHLYPHSEIRSRLAIPKKIKTLILEKY